MKAPRPLPSDPAELFSQAFTAFCEEDYSECVRCCDRLLDMDPSFECMQLALMSLQRSDPLTAKKYAENTIALWNENPWERDLFRLTAGEILPETLLARARDNREKLQIHYYSGARMQAEFRQADAAKHYAHCAALAATYPELQEEFEFGLLANSSSY